MPKKRGRPTKEGSVLHEIRAINDRLSGMLSREEFESAIHRIERLLKHVEHEVEEIEDRKPAINLEAHLVKGITQ